MSSEAKELSSSFLDVWGTIQLKHVSNCLDGRRVPLNVEQRSRRQGDYPYWGANGVVDSIDEYLFDEPLVLIGEDGAPFFDPTRPVAFFVTGKIWVNNHIHVLRIGRNFDPRFVTYCLNATDYGPHIDGSTRDKLTQEKMGSVRLPSPPLPRQRAIADYLDRESAWLDALVAENAQMLELLAEKRRALISSAVTRGIDQNVPLRDSGIPWLSEIPAHWEVVALKRVASLKSGESIRRDLIDVEGDFPVFGGNGLRGYTSVYSHEGEYALIGRQGALCGNVHYTSGRFWASEHAVVVTAGAKCKSKWLGELLVAMNLNQYSQSAAQPGLAVEAIENLRIPVPPILEQGDIVDFIAGSTKAISNLEKATNRTIELLKERRSTLVTDAVTGKLEETYSDEDT